MYQIARGTLSLGENGKGAAEEALRLREPSTADADEIHAPELLFAKMGGKGGLSAVGARFEARLRMAEVAGAGYVFIAAGTTDGQLPPPVNVLS